MSDPGKLTLTLQKNTPTDNGAGGRTDAWANFKTGLSGRLRNTAPRPGDYSQIGPGTQYRTEKVIIFDQPFSPVTTQDYSKWRFVTSAGVAYQVIERNDYERTVQFDVELVA